MRENILKYDYVNAPTTAYVFPAGTLKSIFFRKGFWFLYEKCTLLKSILPSFMTSGLLLG